MATAENAKIQYESGQNKVAAVALTDQGDHLDFRSASTLWSNVDGYTPVVTPNGLVTGGLASIAASGSNNVIDIAALTCYLAGVLTSVNASADLAIARPTATHVKYSVTVTDAGAIAAIKGTEHTAFSDTRGAAGGPPYILPTSIEICQVWLSSSSAGVITADEIKQVVGSSSERYDYPTWEVKRSNVENGALGYAGVLFTSALPLIHSEASPVSPVPKKVYAEYYTPSFTDVQKSSDFVPAEETYSVSSTQIYGQTLGSSSKSLKQSTFTAYLNDGLSDALIAQKGKNLWFKFFPSRYNSTPYMLEQGIFGVSRTFPAGDQIQAACTISAEEAAVEVTTT
ncbi:MAG: hypothetical protein ABFD75_12500 [Smithella sp.]